MSAPGAYSSNKTIVVTTPPPSYETENYNVVIKEKYISNNNEEHYSESKLGLILFLIGFIFPLSWIIGIVMCFSKGIHRSKTWGIVNSIATLFLLLGLAGWIGYIVIRGSPAGVSSSDEILNFPIPTPISKME